ncbi:MAG: hypothetical protein U0790_19215 [Isosphaeraceae bacterium]
MGIRAAPCARVGTRASISSKKMMHGAASFALRKTSRTPRSDSPTYLESSSGPLTGMKFTCVWLATALASMKFQFAASGGPDRRIARRLDAGLGEDLGVLRGHSTASIG